MAVKVRAANPGPAAVWVVNPTKKRRSKKSMATKTKRRGRRKAARRTTTTSRKRTRRVKKVGNMTHHHRRHRTRNGGPKRRTTRGRRRVNRGFFSFLKKRRNPSGLIGEGFVLAFAAAGIQTGLMFIPPIGGVSAVADAARTLAFGWLLGAAMRRTGILGQYAREVQLAGATLAGGKIITAFVLPWVSRLSSRATAPAAMPAADSGVKGIGLYSPGMVPFKRYMAPHAGDGGMHGIGLYQEGMVPFNQYQPLPISMA